MFFSSQPIFYYIKYQSGSGANVTVYGMSGEEGQDPAGTDPIDLQLPRGATSSGTPQTSTTSITRLFDTKSLLFFVFDRETELRSFFLGNVVFFFALGVELFLL